MLGFLSSVVQCNSSFYVTKNCSVTSLFLLPFESLIWTRAIGASISNLILWSRLACCLEDSRQLKRSTVFSGNVSSLWSLGLGVGVIGKLLKLHSSLGQTLGPGPQFSPLSLSQWGTPSSERSSGDLEFIYQSNDWTLPYAGHWPHAGDTAGNRFQRPMPWHWVFSVLCKSG